MQFLLDKSGQKQKYPLYPVYMINFIGSLGFSIVVPFLVFLNQEFGGNALIFGLLGGIYPLMQIFGAPLLGKWSDKVGRKKVLIISQAGTLICWGLYIVAVFVPIISLVSVDEGAFGAFTITLPLLLLFIARGLDGLTGGNISVANSYIADVTPQDQLTQKLGRMALSYNLGFVGGPIIGGVLGSILAGTAAENATPPILAAFLISLFGLFVVLKLRASPKFDKESHVEVQTSLGLYTEPTDHVATVVKTKERHVKSFWKLKFAPYVLVIYFVSFVAINFQGIAFPLHTQTELGWSSFDLAIFMAISSIVMMIVQGPVLKRISHKVSDGQIAIFGNVALIGSFVFLYIQDDLFLLFGAISLGIGMGWVMPSLQSIISKLAGEDLQGTAQGAIASSGALAGTIGFMTGGAIYSFIGDAIFLIAAAIAFVAFVMCFKLTKNIKKNNFN